MLMSTGIEDPVHTGSSISENMLAYKYAGIPGFQDALTQELRFLRSALFIGFNVIGGKGYTTSRFKSSWRVNILLPVFLVLLFTADSLWL